MRIAPQIEFTSAERMELEKITRSTTSPVGSVIRARIILATADNPENRDIAKSIGISVNSVGKWRRRFARKRIAGLQDAERSCGSGSLISWMACRRPATIRFRGSRSRRPR